MSFETTVMAKMLKLFSWGISAIAASAALYGMFAHWAVNAESLGKHDLGLAIFFASSGALALITCIWLIPVAVTMAIVVKLAKAGSSWICLLAAVFGALPFLLLR